MELVVWGNFLDKVRKFLGFIIIHEQLQGFFLMKDDLLSSCYKCTEDVPEKTLVTNAANAN